MRLLNIFIRRTLIILTIFMFSVSMHAQRAANTLYNKGIAAQKIKTIESQNEAIEYFIKAKKAYDSKANKAKCDAAIGKCKELIVSLDPPTLAIGSERLQFEDISAPGYIKVVTNQKDWSVRLASTEGGSDFAAAQKTDDGSEIKITCLDNNTYQTRVAIFEITAGELKKEVRIEQKGLHVNFAVEKTSIECKKKGGSVAILVGSDCKDTYGENNDLKWRIVSKPDWVEVSSSKRKKSNFKENLKNIFKGPDEPLVSNGEISVANIMYLAIDKKSDDYAKGRFGEVILESGNKQIKIKLQQQ